MSALGDLALRVPGFHLYVGLRVASGGVMGDRGVPQVVEHAERLRDRRRLDRRPQVDARELGGVERRAELPVPEDEISVRLVGRFLPLLVEGGDDDAADLEGAQALAALRRLELPTNERLADGKPPLKQLNIPPAKREQLAGRRPVPSATVTSLRVRRQPATVVFPGGSASSWR
jgi:hypothetical protein